MIKLRFLDAENKNAEMKRIFTVSAILLSIEADPDPKSMTWFCANGKKLLSAEN